MKNYQPNYLSMLLLMFVCIASCSNETTSGPGFEIGGTPAESVYQIPSDRKVLLPGTGFQTGDIVRLTDTGISHNTYRVEAAVEDDGAVITLPGNFVDGRYELFIVRGTRQVRYGLAVFRADSDRPGELDRPDYDRLTADAGRAALGEKAVQLVFDASNPNTASAGAGYMQSILLAGQQSGAAMPETRLLYNPQMKSAYNFVPGIMGLIFILICAMMTSVSIVREKETGTMEVLLVSPVRPLRIVVAKMIPYFLLSCVNLATILLLARFVLGVPMSGSVVGLVGLSLLYLVLALALGLFISTMADSQVTAMLISGMLLILPLIMLSGMVFPIENMPGVLQGISCIVPARWYIEAVRKLMVEGLPFAAVLKEFAVLAVMTGALIGVALGKFNDKLE